VGFASLTYSYAQKVSLRVTTRSGVGDVTRDTLRVELFEKKYPNIEVKMEPFTGEFHLFDQMLSTWCAAGNAPDLVCMDFELLEHVLKDQLLPLDQFTSKDEDFQEWKYSIPESLDEFTYAGKLYGLPRGLYTYIYWINADLYRKQGLSIPTLENSWTLDEFMDSLKKLTVDFDGDGRIDQYGGTFWSFTHDLLPWYFREIAGINLWKFDPETGFVTGTNLADPRALEALKWKVGLREVSPPPVAADQLESMGVTFPLGKVATIQGATWSIPGYREEIGEQFEWVAVPYPVSEKGSKPLHMILQRPMGSIMSSTKYPEAAWEFLKTYSGYETEEYIFNNSRYIQYGSPRFKNSLNLLDWLLMDPPGIESTSLLLKALRGRIYFSPENKYPQGYEEWRRISTMGWMPVLKGESTVEEFLDTYYEKMEASIEWTEETKKNIEGLFSK